MMSNFIVKLHASFYNLMRFYFRIHYNNSTNQMAERTYIMIKPDGVQRGLVGAIIARFEQKGYYLRALQLLTPTRELLE